MTDKPVTRERDAYCSYCDALVSDTDVMGGNKHRACEWPVNYMPRRAAETGRKT